jgi:hypothetical protein
MWDITIHSTNPRRTRRRRRSGGARKTKMVLRWKKKMRKMKNILD